MHKTKKIKTIIVEKFKYDDYCITVEPSLLLKLLEFAYDDAKSDEQLHSIVARASMLSHGDDCLEMEDYHKIIAEPVVIEARDKFRSILNGMMSHTRICIEEDEEHH